MKLIECRLFILILILISVGCTNRYLTNKNVTEFQTEFSTEEEKVLAYQDVWSINHEMYTGGFLVLTNKGIYLLWPDPGVHTPYFSPQPAPVVKNHWRYADSPSVVLQNYSYLTINGVSFIVSSELGMFYPVDLKNVVKILRDQGVSIKVKGKNILREEYE